jgi:hypothetical protein
MWQMIRCLGERKRFDRPRFRFAIPEGLLGRSDAETATMNAISGRWSSRTDLMRELHAVSAKSEIDILPFSLKFRTTWRRLSLNNRDISTEQQRLHARQTSHRREFDCLGIVWKPSQHPPATLHLAFFSADSNTSRVTRRSPMCCWLFRATYPPFCSAAPKEPPHREIDASHFRT